MMTIYLNDFSHILVDALSQNESLQDYKVLHAYPYKNKPVFVRDVMIAVMPGSYDCAPCDLDLNCYGGEFTVNVMVYIGRHSGAPEPYAITREVVGTVAALMPTAISVGEVTAHDELNAYCVKCSFTFATGLYIREE